MILVKSLIVLFLLLLFARFAQPITNFLLNLFDERENFANANEVGAYDVGANEVGAYDAEGGAYANANAYAAGSGANANAVGANAVGANAVGANAVGANAVGANANAVGPNIVGTMKYTKETKYTGQLPSASETGLANDAKLITDMQFKLNELMQLKEESIIISKLVENNKKNNG
jgi:hypothetical protein